MPPRYYTVVNSKGRLSQAERDDLIEGLRRTFGSGEREDEQDDDD